MTVTKTPVIVPAMESIRRSLSPVRLATPVLSSRSVTSTSRVAPQTSRVAILEFE